MKVKNAQHLLELALQRKALVGYHAHRDIPMPAAFIIGMPFFHVMNRLSSLRVYKPLGKKRWKLPHDPT